MQKEYGFGEKKSRLREIREFWVLRNWRGTYFIKVSQGWLTNKVTERENEEQGLQISRGKEFQASGTTVQRPCGESLLDNFEQMNEMIWLGFSRTPLAAEWSINQKWEEREVSQRDPRREVTVPWTRAVAVGGVRSPDFRRYFGIKADGLFCWSHMQCERKRRVKDDAKAWGSGKGEFPFTKMGRWGHLKVRNDQDLACAHKSPRGLSLMTWVMVSWAQLNIWV